ncbi:MAG: hypothetical protein A3K03_03800, partial [Bdellovibrionales bacterium RIFOXYD1_FULL_44_7]
QRTMNCVELFCKQVDCKPESIALWVPGRSNRATSFSELYRMAGAIQQQIRQKGLTPGTSVLLVDNLGPRLFAAIIAIIASGGIAIIVEPWMPIAKIQKAISLVKPQIFITNLLGKLWGVRIPAIRAIPHSLSIAESIKTKGQSLDLTDLKPHSSAILTFTSGTTAEPKAVLRTHNSLHCQYQTLSRALGLEKFHGSDLCVFANFALANLAAGRTSLLVPQKWSRRFFRSIDDLPANLKPQSFSSGPAFLTEAMKHAKLESLCSVHIGGALTSCDLFESAFRKWPSAHFLHVYGSTEAEPVTVSDARIAVAKSRNAQYFHTTFIGRPVPEVEHQIDNGQLLIRGKHVCPKFGSTTEADTWHAMGDRIETNIETSTDGWWYLGRNQQSKEDFLLEQKIYRFLQSDTSFIHRDQRHLIHLIGEGVKTKKREIVETFPEIRTVTEAKIR